MLNAPDAGLAAVVVGMKSSDPKRSVVWAPIDVKLLDADGTVIAENNIDGALPSLVHVPSLPASGEAFYVNDQLAPGPAGGRAGVCRRRAGRRDAAARPAAGAARDAQRGAR